MTTIEALNELVVELTRHADLMADALVELNKASPEYNVGIEQLVYDYRSFVSEA